MQHVRERCSVRNGRMDLQEDDFAGRPSTSKTAEGPARRDELVLENRRVAHFEMYPLHNKEVEIALRE